MSPSPAFRSPPSTIAPEPVVPMPHRLSNDLEFQRGYRQLWSMTRSLATRPLELGFHASLTRFEPGDPGTLPCSWTSDRRSATLHYRVLNNLSPIANKLFLFAEPMADREQRGTKRPSAQERMERLKKAAKTGDRGKGIAESSSTAPPSKAVAPPSNRAVAAPLSRMVVPPSAPVTRLSVGSRHVPGIRGKIIV